MGFGKLIRSLRSRTGLGIKRVAPDLGVTYSYLSKLENDEVGPSQDLVLRIASYYSEDKDKLLLAAGKVPEDIIRILQNNPEAATQFLRNRFGKRPDK